MEQARKETPGTARGVIPAEAEILAFAYRSRTADGGSVYLKLAAALGTKGRNLEALAELCDAVIERQSPVSSTSLGFYRIWTGLMWAWRRFLAPAIPLIFSVQAAAWTYFHSWSEPPYRIELEAAIAALAAVVTVNVFTVQLSSTRLPGSVARAAGHPWYLTASYSASLIMLATVSMKVDAPRLANAFHWSGLVAVIVFALALIAAVIALVGRTDAPEAAAAFVKLRQSKYASVGRRLGKMQAKAIELTECMDSIPSVVRNSGRVVGERSDTVSPRTRGFLLLSARHLKRLLRRPEIDGGTRVRLLSTLGNITESGEAVLSLVPGHDQRISRRTLRLAERVIQTYSSSTAEAVSSSIVALFSHAAALAKAGDIGTGQRVARSAMWLLEVHVSSARNMRKRDTRRQALKAKAREDRTTVRSGVASSAAERRSRDEAVVPAVPALRDLTTVAVRARLDSAFDLGEIPEGALDTMLRISGRAEGVGHWILITLPESMSDAKAKPAALMGLVRRVGLHALERGDFLLWISVLDKLNRYARQDDGEPAVSMTGVLASTACRFDLRFAKRALKDLAEQTDKSRHRVAAATGLWHIGGAALAVGAISVAVAAARVLASRDQADMLGALATTSTLRNEKTRAELLGGYLGDNGGEALKSFASMASSLGQPLLSS
ncbi:hypothetical protein AB0L34_21780 [Micromonospora sp. NPDC052213]|uniref:hypothetical protein n=1 Tax=Micromonospora sp. NPDC052213 TaxID=3155812 RepID=UPI0034462ED2